MFIDVNKDGLEFATIKLVELATIGSVWFATLRLVEFATIRLVFTIDRMNVGARKPSDSNQATLANCVLAFVLRIVEKRMGRSLLPPDHSR